MKRYNVTYNDGIGKMSYLDSIGKISHPYRRTYVHYKETEDARESVHESVGILKVAFDFADNQSISFFL